ncbi:MAG: 4-hydroxy-tetrahydrodipicolinate reductase [Pseudomonadota bacterium]
MEPTRIAVMGAAGRMGRSTLAAIAARGDCMLAAALVRARGEGEGALDAVAGVFPPAAPLADRLDPAVAVDVLVDFSGVGGFDRALQECLARRIPLVSGSTGLSPAQVDAAQRAATRIPVLLAANFSLGVARLRRLVASAAAALGPDFDVEICEVHHRAKVDAPSGTALALGHAVAAARGQNFDVVARFDRHDAPGPRVEGEIGFAVLRAGDVVGEHTVLLATEGERLELSHRVSDRTIFARGAVAAACWIVGRSPGWYDIADVLS